MNNRYTHIVLFCLVWVYVGACVDPIELAGDSQERFVVINGHISDQPGPYRVSVRKSATPKLLEEGVSGAEVRMLTGSGQITSLSEILPGIYETDSSEIVGKVGESYHIEVVLPDGKVYTSIAEEMQPKRPIGELSFKFVREEVLNEISNIVLEKRIRVSITNPVPANTQDLFYKWEVSGEYEFRETNALSDIFATTGAGPLMFTCFLPEPLAFGDIYVLDGKGLAGMQQFTEEIKVIPVNYKFAFNYCVHVKQLSINEGAFNFWNQVQKLSERNGLFQASSAGSIQGNISNVNDPAERVLGYFYTASISSERMFVSPDSVANPFSPCFLIDPVFASACEECLELKGSFRGAPDYWPE